MQLKKKEPNCSRRRIKRKMKRRKKEEREAWYSEKGKREKKNELNYKELRIEKKNIAKEWRRNRKRERTELYSKVKEPIHTERKIERRKRKKGRKITSFLESEGRRREASVSAIPGFLESNIGRRKEEEKGSIGICDSWFYRESLHTERSSYGGTHGRI